jgi:eukaryotic-like serine/threonine-protein kinase
MTDSAALERLQRLDALLNEALTLPPDARAALIERLARDSAEDAQALERLLKAALSDDPLLDGARWARLDPDLASAHEAGQQIGPYQLKRLLGSGGMGEVWLAVHASNQTLPPMALKLIRSQLSVGVLRARLKRERDILIRLTHPHIARLLDSGMSDDGEPYLALEYVEGAPLLAHAAERGLTVRERVRLIAQVADALAYAQTQLVVHRDIKPQNILVTPAGAVKLLDFGIAKLLDLSHGATQLTGHAQRLLTPAYAAPEQLRGEAVSTSADVYSLGVVMHELLLGVRPSATHTESIDKPSLLARTHQAPGLPIGANALARALRGDLDVVLRRALKPDPAERYPSAAALAQDLDAYLAQRPLKTRPDRLGYRVRKLIARHRVATAAALVALVAVSSGLTVSWQQARIAAREGARAAYVQAFLERVFSNDLPGAPREDLPSTAELLKRGSAQALGDSRAEPGARLALLLAIARIQQAQRDSEGAEKSLITARAVLPKVDDAPSWRGPSIDAELASLRAARNPGDRGNGLDALVIAIDLAIARGAPLQRRIEIQNALVAAQVDAGLGSAARASAARALHWLAALERAPAEPAAPEPAIRLRLNTLSQAIVAATFEQQPIAGTEALARRAVALAEEHFGAAHAESAYALMRLALVLRIDGKLNEALAAAARASAIAREVYPPQHPQLARILEEHARLEMRLKRHAAGIALWREVLAIRTAQSGPDSFSAARTQGFLAGALLRDGQIEPAAEMGQQALVGLARTVGPSHLNSFDALGFTATALIRLKRMAEARALLPPWDAPVPSALEPSARWRFLDLQWIAVRALPPAHQPAALAAFIDRLALESASPKEEGIILLELAGTAANSELPALAARALGASGARFAQVDQPRWRELHQLLALTLAPPPRDHAQIDRLRDSVAGWRTTPCPVLDFVDRQHPR